MHSCIHAFMHSCINAFMHSCIHSLHSFIHSFHLISFHFIHSFIHSFISFHFISFQMKRKTEWSWVHPVFGAPAKFCNVHTVRFWNQLIICMQSQRYASVVRECNACVRAVATYPIMRPQHVTTTCGQFNQHPEHDEGSAVASQTMPESHAWWWHLECKCWFDEWRIAMSNKMFGTNAMLMFKIASNKLQRNADMKRTRIKKSGTSRLAKRHNYAYIV